MRRFVGVLAVTVVVAALSAQSAMAFNDCCWDWGHPGTKGAQDEWLDPKKPASSQGWAQCIPVPKADCFKRQNRQMKWIDWECLVGSNSPNGEVPGPGNGFLCRKKGFIDPVALVATSIPPATSPPNVVPADEIDQEAAITPGANTVGLGVVAAIMLLSGAWILYRKRASTIA